MMSVIRALGLFVILGKISLITATILNEERSIQVEENTFPKSAVKYVKSSHRIFKRDIDPDVLTEIDTIMRHLQVLYTQDAELRTRLNETVVYTQRNFTELQDQIAQGNEKINNLTLENLELRTMIENMNRDNNATFKQLNSRNKDLEPLMEWLKSENEKGKVGKLVSFNETGKATDSQYGGCGGILIGESGEISYESPSNMTSGESTKIQCIWTIRAKRKYYVKFQLVADQLGDGEIKFNGVSILPTQISSQNKTLHSGQRNEFTLFGYVMFVTLLADSSTPVRFTLTYQGIGDDSARPWLYSHYHFTESDGSVEFPRIREDSKYAPNEMATFVISPKIRKTNLQIQTLQMDTENINNCAWDALLHYPGKMNQSEYFILDGPSSTRNRYCGQMGSLNGSFSGGSETESFISIFTSNSDGEYSGFKFNWTSARW